MTSSRFFSWYLLGFFLLTLIAVMVVPGSMPLLDIEKVTYLPVHTFLEMIGIFSSLGIFLLGWSTYRNVGSQKILFLSVSSLAVACFDFAHTLSFAGMPTFVTESEPNKAIYFWLAGRVTDAVAFLFVALPLKDLDFKKWRWPGLVLSLFWVCVVYHLVLWHPDSLPLMFVRGEGLTPLKIGIEWAAIVMSLVAAALFFRKWKARRKNGKVDLSDKLMTCGCVLFSMGGLLFCLYRDVDDLYNLVGHIYKTVAYLYIFGAVFLVCVRRPYQTLKKINVSAKAASDSKSRFLANVSHEFRTPLGVISGFSELLQSKNLDAESSTWAETIRRNADQLRVLIDDLLDLTKAESGNITITPGVVNPKALTEEVVQGLSLLAEQKGLELKLTVDAKTPAAILIDSQRLRQILVNIIGNAVKFTTNGFVQIEVRSSADHALHFFVQDSGVGISVENAKFLFRPFTQVDDSFTRRSGGTGLGLALSKKLSQLLGGDLWLEKSAPGQGSLFVFTISYEDASSEIPGYAVKSRSLPVLPGLRILAAEDSVDNQFLLKQFLKDSQAELEMVGNGLLALEYLKKSSPDVILMDIQMPEMDGLTATKEIRKQGWTGPIIAMTAHAHDSERRNALSNGFDEYLVKPFTRRELNQMLLKVRPKQ